MELHALMDGLESEWESEGFLGRLREGCFPEEGAAGFLEMLRGISIPDDTAVPKRFVSLIWALPTFLSWQRDRVVENGGDARAYDRFVTEACNALEAGLGAP